ncbi:MAG: AraC family transcriptional regulator [Clostridia bacterium]
MLSFFDPSCLEVGLVPVVHAYYDRADMMRTTVEAVNHSHSLIEIMYVNEGLMSLEVEGETLQIGRKQLIWLDANAYHRHMTFLTDACSVMNIEFQYERLDRRCPTLRELSRADAATREMLGAPTYCLVLTDNDNAIFHLMKQIVPLADSTFPEAERLCSLLCTQVMLLVAKLHKETAGHSVPINNPYVDEAIAMMQRDYAGTITATELARRLHIQPTYLHRLFRDHTGQTFGQHLQRIRVQKAKELLLTTDDTLLDIAMAVGASSQQRFTQMFRRMESVSPQEYRKQHDTQPGAGKR